MSEALRLSVPIHITGFWRIHIEESLESSGSTGAGLNMGPRVVGRILRSGHSPPRILLNGTPLDTCMTRYLLLNSGSEKVSGTIEIASRVPLGAGFALSAAISLITSYGLHYLKGRDVGEVRPAVDAHNAEVYCRTGLGDVIAQYYGGSLEIRVKPGAPGYGRTVRIRVDGRYKALVVVLRRRLDTPTMLRSYGPLINRYGGEALRALLRRPTLKNFLELSRSFSSSVGMFKGLEEAVGQLDSMVEDGVLEGFYVKKNVLVAVVRNELVEEAFDRLAVLFSPSSIYRCWLEDEGLRIEKV